MPHKPSCPALKNCGRRKENITQPVNIKFIDLLKKETDILNIKKFNSYRFHIYIHSCIYEKFGDILSPFFGSPMKSSLQKNNPNVHESDCFINLVYHM